MSTPHASTCALTALELTEAYRAGTLSPVEATEEALAAITRLDPALNAFCLVDPEGARAAARAAEQRYRHGDPLGPLDGVPVTIKDIFLTADHPTLRGSRLLADGQAAAPPTDDAPAVAATRDAG
ncbi:amidase family protein, partial [Gordonia sihwensis]